MKATEAMRPLLLLVDDEPAVLAALEAELRPSFGDLCQIESFEHPGDVLEALDRWESEGRAVALAIVDQRMPGLTGIELLQKLRASALQRGSPGTPVPPRFSPAAAARSVLLTGFGGPGVEAAARNERGVTLYREKPWGREELARDVGSLLGEFWNAAKRESHPAYREFVSASELARLWGQLEPANPDPAPPGRSATGRDGLEIPKELWEYLREAVKAQAGDVRPSEEALTAFVLDNASDAQRAEVRRALLASSEFRRDLIYLMGQLRRLDSFEARLAFDETTVPDWVKRLARGGSAER